VPYEESTSPLGPLVKFALRVYQSKSRLSTESSPDSFLLTVHNAWSNLTFGVATIMAQIIPDTFGIFSGKSMASETVVTLGVQMESSLCIRFVRCSFALVLVLAVVLLCPPRIEAGASRTPQSDSTFNPQVLAARFRPMAAFKADSVPHDYVAFGDARGYMHVLRKKGAGFVHAWSTFYLGSPVKEILADDIEANGVTELVVVTSAGKMFIFDTNTHQRLWENTGNDFQDVSTLVIDQLDRDVAKELILCADSRLLVMDGEKLLREYQSADTFNAEYMVIGDVDNDGEKEIVLDSGFVVNAKSLYIEWQTDYFGTRLALFDFDGDGIDELMSESAGGGLRVYDLDIRQEKAVF
jgi:hypothetical protein